MLAVLATLVVLPLSLSASANAASAPTPTPTQQKAMTALVLQRLLNQFVVPASASIADPPPAPLAAPGEYVGSPHYINRGRVWVVPDKPSATLAFVRDHRPAGLTFSGSGASSIHGVVTMRSINFGLAGRWNRPRLYAYGGAVITVVPLDHRKHTGLRIDVSAVWLAARSAAQTIPQTATRVELRVQRGTTGKQVSRQFTSATAQRFARQVNALTVAPDITPFSCPLFLAVHGHYRDLITFDGPGPKYTVVVPVYECTPRITIRRGSTRVGPGLTGDLDTAVLKVMHLPAGYGLPRARG